MTSIPTPTVRQLQRLLTRLHNIAEVIDVRQGEREQSHTTRWNEEQRAREFEQRGTEIKDLWAEIGRLKAEISRLSTTDRRARLYATFIRNLLDLEEDQAAGSQSKTHELEERR